VDKTILVVGHHQAYADVVAEVLRHYGFQATAVYTLDAALGHLVEQLPALIVCDVRRPRMDGAALARRIRDLGHGCLILLMSGEPIPPVDLPAVSVARKMTEVEELITLIEQHLRCP
jgi:CheY-like chemotaxis protein